MSPRPGFVLEVDGSTPPTLFWNGEGFSLRAAARGQPGRLRTRAARSGRPTRSAAIRHALEHPVGDSAPLRALLRPGMRLTICFDDVSLPLPPMRAPDVRQLVIEQVLDLAAAAGVDDVVLIAALALHRRMTEAELRHALGDRIYEAFAPHGLLTQHDAEDPDNLLDLGRTDRGRGGGDQQAGGDERPARLREHHPRRHGRRPQERGHRAGQLPEPPPPPQPDDHAPLAARSWTRPPRSCTPPTGGWAGSSPTAGVKVFQIETTLNTDTFPSQFALPPEARVGVEAAGPGHLRGDRRRARRHPGPAVPADLPLDPGPPRPDLGAGGRGGGGPRARRWRASGASRGWWSRARPTS